MTLLLEAGADSRARGQYGDALLHGAASLDRADLAAVLIAHGADVNVRNDSGQTPLHFAARQGSRAVAELLLASGADVNVQANDIRTPLNEVYGNDPAMKALLERHGARLAGELQGVAR